MCQCVVCLCARVCMYPHVLCACVATHVSVHKPTSAQVTFAYVRVCTCAGAEAPPGQGSPSLLLLLPWISPPQTAPPSRQLEANTTCIFPELLKGERPELMGLKKPRGQKRRRAVWSLRVNWPQSPERITSPCRPSHCSSGKPQSRAGATCQHCATATFLLWGHPGHRSPKVQLTQGALSMKAGL